MAHPLYWPSKQFFYPIGNTPAVSLTRDLSPEQPADILLLGCGDPRNILFTLYSDVTVDSIPRKMDVTCCDLEPGILARNILLFALLESNEPINRVWDIFYHFKIDSQALEVLVDHSRELFNHAQSVKTWKKSRYGSFLKMVDARTLGELRRYWKNYAEFPDLPSNRLESISLEQSTTSESILEKVPLNISASRSAGMLWHQAMGPVAKLAQSYWKTGTTFKRTNDISAATMLNPTFIYSLSGETFNPHYGTFPGAGFHLTPAFAAMARDPAGLLANAGSPTLNVSIQQFKAWCESFRAARAANSITIRFYTGDALAFCRALESVATGEQSTTHIFASPWRAPQLTLGKPGADSAGPITFDVVDTSNLADHLGLLNLLITASPLLKKNPASQSVMYTETLIPGTGDATQSLLRQLCTDIPTLACLLGVAPRAYLSGFTTESSVHELPMVALGSQLHERIAWVDPRSGDHHVSNASTKASFEAIDLIRVLHGIYQTMFSSEALGVLSLIFSGPSNAQARLQEAERMHFSRETFALLFRAIQRRVTLHEGTWIEVAGDFLTLVRQKASSKVALENYQDLCLQFHVYGIYSVPSLEPDFHDAFRSVERTKVFSNQSPLPTTLCVTLVVPRRSLRFLLDDPEQIGNLVLQCSVFDNDSRNSYSALHAVWGKLAQQPDLGTVCISEDPAGIEGRSDLVVSFWAHSRFLEHPDAKVSFGIKASPRSTKLFLQKLGPQLDIFTTSILANSPINVSIYRPSLATEVSQTIHNTGHKMSLQPTQTETSEPTCRAVVNWLGEPNIISLSTRFQASSALQKQSLHDESVSTRQIGPCTIKFEVGDHVGHASYIYPVLGSNHERDINKELKYIDVVAPVSDPLDDPANISNPYPFPIIRKNAYAPWNMHHVHLDRLPVLKTQSPRNTCWLDAHCGLQFSDREREIVHDKGGSKDGTTNILTDIKFSVDFILKKYAGADGPPTRSFLLCEASKGDIYAVLLVSGIRLDLASSTVVADSAIVPVSEDKKSYLMPRVQSLPRSTVSRLTSLDHEIIALKRLLPAVVERCRVWEHKPSCEYASKNDIPVSLELGQNPLCSCGQGVGFTSTQWKVPEWKVLLPLATRGAISPIFSVPYIERTTITPGGSLSATRAWQGARPRPLLGSNASTDTRLQAGRNPNPTGPGGSRRYSLLRASTKVVMRICTLV